MFFLAWLAFVPLLWAHRNSTVKAAFLLGWVAGIVANFGNFYWIYELVVAHSAIPAVGGILVTLLAFKHRGVLLFAFGGDVGVCAIQRSGAGAVCLPASK